MAAKGLIDEVTLKSMMLSMDENINGYRVTLENLKAKNPKARTKEEALKNIEDAFNEIIDFSRPVIDSEVIDRFVHKIIVCEDFEFIWILDFNIENNKESIIKYSNHINSKYKSRQKMFQNYNVFWEFEVDFEECSEYVKSRGRRLVKRSWDTLKVKVALVN